VILFVFVLLLLLQHLKNNKIKIIIINTLAITKIIASVPSFE